MDPGSAAVHPEAAAANPIGAAAVDPRAPAVDPTGAAVADPGAPAVDPTGAAVADPGVPAVDPTGAAVGAATVVDPARAAVTDPTHGHDQDKPAGSQLQPGSQDGGACSLGICRLRGVAVAPGQQGVCVCAPAAEALHLPGPSCAPVGAACLHATARQNAR